MKQARRKELRTNDLIVYLQQLSDAAQKNATYLIGGLVAVVAILVILLLVKQRTHRAEQAAWDAYYTLSAQSVVQNPEVLDQARALADAHIDDGQLGPLAIQLEADFAYNLATSSDDKERRIKLFKESRDSYQKLLDRYGSREDVAARAKYALAGIEVSLAIHGAGDKEKARQYYKELADGNSPFKQLATFELSQLDQALRPIQIVASRPAATQPVLRPIPGPATSTAPAATTPAE
jgi:hypothetical protein